MVHVYVKKNVALIKNLLFDKKHTALLWFSSGFVWEAYCGTFCQRAAILQNVPHFFDGKSLAL